MTRTVRDIMRTEVVSISVHARMPEIERLLIDTGVTACPVVDDEGRVCGMLSRSDIIRQLYVEHSRAEEISDYYRDPAGIGIVMPDGESFERIAAAVGVRMDHLRAETVMSPAVVSVEPSTTIARAAHVMADEGLHRLPVIEQDRLRGMISSLDIARLVAVGTLS